MVPQVFFGFAFWQKVFVVYYTATFLIRSYVSVTLWYFKPTVLHSERFVALRFDFTTLSFTYHGNIKSDLALLLIMECCVYVPVSVR